MCSAVVLAPPGKGSAFLKLKIGVGLLRSDGEDEALKRRKTPLFRAEVSKAVWT